MFNWPKYAYLFNGFLLLLTLSNFGDNVTEATSQEEEEVLLTAKENEESPTGELPRPFLGHRKRTRSQETNAFQPAENGKGMNEENDGDEDIIRHVDDHDDDAAYFIGGEAADDGVEDIAEGDVNDEVDVTHNNDDDDNNEEDGDSVGVAVDGERKESDSVVELENNTLRNARFRRRTVLDLALEASAREGLNAVTEFYGKIEPNILKNGQLLAGDHPAALLSKFSAPLEETEAREMAAYATIAATKAFKKNYKQFNISARQAHSPKVSLRRTALEGLCPPRDPPTCMPASERYRTHDGTCNNKRRPRWGAAQMPFNRFLPPQYGDGVDTIRNSVEGGTLASSRFVSLLVHGAKDGDAPLTLMTAQWGQLLDHDMTSTAQPRSINGSVPSCCGGKDFHPSCFPIKVPPDDPWLAPLKVRCLEFLRSAPAQRRDCVLSWREQTNQATSYIDASPIYSSSAKNSDNSRTFRSGFLIFGRGNAADDVCKRGGLATQCIRSGDGRSGEQPGLLALHHVWVGEHNRIASELSELNLHWSDEKIYQETRRIIGAMFQHITYREFLPIVVGREVCKLFELDLQTSGYFEGYSAKTNPGVANSFAAAAFRFGHSLIQNSYMRCDRHHNMISTNVSLHEEFQRGDIGSAGSLHRLLRGLASQKALKRDEFISPELTNHLFQTPGFPFGLDLAAINIQRGRDHGIAPYTAWRIPCGLSPVNSWEDFLRVVGPESAKRISHAYSSVHDVDLFVGGISERPVVGGLVGPTFACIIAQQFSNSRKGDRFWYENGGFESSLTPAQLQSIRQVSLAQVLCRAVGGGTFQPHIFIPHDLPGNQRLPCGVGALAPIDLRPWLEQDPFEAAAGLEAALAAPERVFDIVSTADSLPSIPFQLLQENTTDLDNGLQTDFVIRQHTPHSDFIPNSATGLRQTPEDTSKINDKLDFKRKGVSTKRPPTQHRPVPGVNNKLSKQPKITLNIKSLHNGRRRPQTTTTKRTVIVNNGPIELRSSMSEPIKEANSEQNAQFSSASEKDSTTTTLTVTTQNSNNNSLVGQNILNEKGDDHHADDELLRKERKTTEKLRLEVTKNWTDPENKGQIPNKTEAMLKTSRGEAKRKTPDYALTQVLFKLTEQMDRHFLCANNGTRCHHPTSEKTNYKAVNESLSKILKTNESFSYDTKNFTSFLEPIDHEAPRQTRRSTTKNNSNPANVTEDEIVAQKEGTEPKIITKTANDRRSVWDSEGLGDYNLFKTSERTASLARNVPTESSIYTLQYLPKNQNPDKRNQPIPPPTSAPDERSSVKTIEYLKKLNGIHPLTHSVPKEHRRVPRHDNHIKSGRAHKQKLLLAKRQPVTNDTLRNEATTTTTTKRLAIRKKPRPTPPPSPCLELRQYQHRPIYTRPQKVIVDGPNSDQYEIEINIRQTNKTAALKPSSGSDTGHTMSSYQLYDRYDRYSNYKSSTRPYEHYPQGPTTAAPDTFLPNIRTKPPTIIYLNEDYIMPTTTKKSTILQSFLSFASSGLDGIQQLVSPNQLHKQKLKPEYVPSAGISSTLINSPHSSMPSSQYIPGPLQQLSRPPSPIASSSFSQLNGYPGNAVAIAASSAVSSGIFGSIMGMASANGADSTFSFNIRPRPIAGQPVASPSHPTDGLNHGLRPAQTPTYSQTFRPEYANVPQEHFYKQQVPEASSHSSPFSTGNKRPLQQPHYSRTQTELLQKQITLQVSENHKPTDHKIDDYDYDYLSKNLEPSKKDNSDDVEDEEVEVDVEDGTEKTDILYDDYSTENEGVGKRFDKDGYLRPEHMLQSLISPNVLTTRLNVNDNTTIVRDADGLSRTITDSPLPNKTVTTKNTSDAVGKNLNNEILAEDHYDENVKSTSQDGVTATSSRKVASSQAFTPITILTKPERPDNWVFYDSPLKISLLPELPQFKMDTSAAVEVPIPFAGLSNLWLNNYRNKLIKARDSAISTNENVDITKASKTNIDDVVSVDNNKTNTTNTSTGTMTEDNIDRQVNRLKLMTEIN